MSLKIYFAVLDELYNNIGQPFSSLAIIQLHTLSFLQKTVQIRDRFFLYMDPDDGYQIQVLTCHLSYDQTN
jgi:hypothetical protein